MTGSANAADGTAGCSNRYHLVVRRPERRRILLLIQALLALGLLTSLAGENAVMLIAFLIGAPAIGVVVATPGVAPLARAAFASVVAVVVNAGVAQFMASAGTWSVDGGVRAVAVVSAVLVLFGCVKQVGVAATKRDGPSEPS